MSDRDESGRYIPDDDERREAWLERRRQRMIWGPCRCGTDLPGVCPGPSNCPLQQMEDE